MLKQRARGEEFMDRPDSDPRLTQESFRFIKFVNHVGGGIRVVRKFLERELPNFPAGRTVKILDLGGGDCDIPLAITQWATNQGHSVEFTCADHNPQVLAMAKESLARAHCKAIRLEQTDIFTYQPPEEFDYALGSMVFHHFTAEENRPAYHAPARLRATRAADQRSSSLWAELCGRGDSDPACRP